MEIDPTRMCELLVGLPDIDILGVADPEPGRLVVPRRRPPSMSKSSGPGIQNAS